MALTAGVDEAGRGPWAGPVVASAVILPDQHDIPSLRDSKKLSPAKREILYDIIVEKALTIGIGIVDHKEIDQINILKATHKAMQIALGQCRPAPDSALIDGYALPNQIVPNKGIIKGDDKIDCIKAASIIAKVTRDRMMLEYDIIFPEYGFASHKGYGTKKHQLMLDKFKATPIHRISFKPVKLHLPNINWFRTAKRVGWLGERISALYLKKQGHEIISMNYYCGKHGEIDIISKARKELIFTEVKTVSAEQNNPPEVKFDNKKSMHVERSISYYTLKEKWEGSIRLDLITVDLAHGKPIINHFKRLSLD